MGKQKRPRRRNKDNKKKNDANNKQEDSSSTAAVAASTTTTATTTSALLGKIRHANAQTRLAALCALQQNVLIGQNSSNNSNNNSNTSALWQAVREQVLDQTDLAVATTAATCLTEFIVATTTECCSSSSSSTSSSNHHPMTAGWFLVLMGRLQECHAQQQQQQQQSANSGGSNKQQQWLALSLQCLHAICALLETNPLAMERLERTAALRNDSLDTLWQWLDTASSIHQQTTKTGAAADTSTTTTSTPMDTTTTTTAATTTKTLFSTINHGFDYWKEIQEQACRALHSMTEENWSTLLLPWLLQEPKEEQESSMAHRAFTEIGPRILHLPAQAFLAVAAAAVAADSATTTRVQEDSSWQVARLHMAGIYLTCHFGSARSKDNATPSAATTAIIARMEKEMPSVLDVLKRGLVWTKCGNDHLIANLCMAHAQYTQQTLDDVLERDILRRQDAKKESARAIARRLQAVKKQQQQQQQQHNDEQDDKRGRFAEDRTDALQLWQETVAQWYTSIQPLELALEVFANLTLSMSSNSDNDDDDEIMHVDDMDDDDIDNDDRMHPSSSNAVSNSIVGKSLLQQDADGLVNRIIIVLQQLCQTNATLCQSGDTMPAIGKSENDDDAAAAMMMDVSSSSSSPPAIVAESLGDLQSKAAAGIGHCLLAFPSASCWLDVEPQATPKHDHDAGSVVTISSSAFSLWTFLKQCLEQASTAVGRQGIASTMVVTLQSRPLLRKQLQAPAPDLNFLLSLLTTTTTTTQATTTSVPNKDDNMDESSSMSSYHLVRDAVFMLGMLCSPEEDPVEVKEKVCRALLQTLSENCNNTNARANSSKNADASIKSNNNNNIEGSIVVVTEILNVLMDMYGSDDDALNRMFSSLDVLGHFQRTLPLLKQQISVYSSTNRGGGGHGNNVEDDDLLEGWKETAMNASRFIQYKKGHC